MNFSLSAFLPSPSSTIFMILVAVESLYREVAFTSRVDSPLTLPLRILSPFFTFTGTDSPVRALVSMKPSPSMISPSRATFSPAFTMKTSEISTSSGSTSFHSPSTFTLTLSVLRSNSFPMDSLLFSVALCWKYSPTW